MDISHLIINKCLLCPQWSMCNENNMQDENCIKIHEKREWLQELLQDDAREDFSKLCM